jgi:dTDP-4-amino-4,6-dideoxygalactose transaminase
MDDQTVSSQNVKTADVKVEKVRVLVPRLPEATALLPYLARIDANRIYSNYGPLSREFAAGLGQLTGAAGVTLTGNGTSAIELALRVRAPRPGLCLMPAFTFIASAHAVCNAGLTPFLLNVNSDTLELTPEIVTIALPNLPTPPVAVLVVSAFGAPPDQKGWADFEERHGIPVVFDAAAATTALSGIGRQPVCVSLHATKVLGIGEGGAILCADTTVTERATAMTGFGFLGADRVSAIRGGNYRISEYAAAVGLAALQALPQRVDTLRLLSNAYRARLQGRAARLQHGAGDWVTMTLNVILPPQIVAPTLGRLTEANIEWRYWWGMGCHRHPAFADVPRADLTRTDALAPRVLGLPFHDGLTVAEIDRVVACLP